MKDDTLATILLVLLGVPLSILLRAWAFVTLWAWFVCPLGIIEIGMAHGVGLSAMLSMIAYRDNPKEEEGHLLTQFTTGLTQGVFVPLRFLLVGWIAQGLM